MKKKKISYTLRETATGFLKPNLIKSFILVDVKVAENKPVLLCFGNLKD